MQKSAIKKTSLKYILFGATGIIAGILSVNTVSAAVYAKTNFSSCSSCNAAMPLASDAMGTGIIELQLQTEQWVNTNQALVTISVDATIDKTNNFTEIRVQLLQKFAELADQGTTWNITTFSTSQSESGLEQIHVEAQARLQENKLNQLRTKVKDLSKPGLTLRLASIDFSPSVADMENVKAGLRTAIYNEAKNEIVRINKVYPEQKYVLRSIVFQPVTPPIIPLAVNAMAMTNMAMGSNGGGGHARGGSVNKESGGGNTAVMAVSTKMQLSATIELTPTTTGTPTTIATTTQSVPATTPPA